MMEEMFLKSYAITLKRKDTPESIALRNRRTILIDQRIQEMQTTKIYRFDIARLTSIFDKTDFNENMMAFS